MKTASATEGLEDPAGGTGGGGGELEPQPAASLHDVLAESRQANEAEPPAPPKAKRGRPPNCEHGVSAKKCEQCKAKATAAAAPTPDPALELPLSVLEGVVRFPFSLQARRTGFEGWNLSDPEAQELAPMLEQVMKQYLPQVESRHAPLMALATALVVMAGTRYMAQMQAMPKQPEASESSSAASEESAPAPRDVTERIPAAAYQGVSLV